MGKSLNRATLVGNVGHDPDMRYSQNGSAICRLSIATSESWKDKQSGEWQEKTEWHRCVAFGRVAEIIGEHVRKGSRLLVEGRLQTRKWEKDGVDHYTTEVVVNDLIMLGGQDRQGGDSSSASSQSAQAAPAQGGFEDDIPF